MESGGSNPENRALAPRRTHFFTQELTRDGNILVALPDQNTDVEINRRDNQERMKGHIKAFNEKFNQ